MLKRHNLRWRDLVLALLGVVWLCVLVRNIYVHREIFLWDYRAHHFAAAQHLAGGDPYATGNVPKGLKVFSDRYVYSPVTLYFFAAFERLGYERGLIVHFALKCVIFLLLLWLWRSRFLWDEKGHSGLLLFALLAFGGAAEIDLWAGNVTVFEQAALWTAFAAFLAGSVGIFSALVCIVALFKFTPLVFLGLLPFSGHPRRWQWAFGCGLAYLAVLALGWWHWPQHYDGLVRNIRAVFEEPARIAPSVYSLLNRVAAQLLPSREWAKTLALATFVTFAFAVCRSIYELIREAGQAPERERRRHLIFLFMIGYFLLVPRIKDYSYVGLILPAYFVIRRVRFESVYPLLFLIFVYLPLGHTDMPYPGLDRAFDYLRDYYPVVLTLATWALYRRLLAG